VAFAGVMYGNTALVNDNGQPLVKVVVGEKAAASDGVGAAKIVAKIANNAYATKTLRASATATCTGGSATGTCEVSQETVTLEVTIPGLGTGVHNFGLLIADYMDKEVKNRWEPDDEWDELDDLLDPDANVYANQNGTYLLEPVSDVDYFYKISGDNFVPFSRVSVQAGAGRTSSWDEYQYAWTHGNTPRDDNKVNVNIHGGGYSVVFGPDEYGLPLCPGEEDQTYKKCEGTSDSIEAYRMQIKFLGANWIISAVDIPQNSDVIANEDDQTVYEIPGSKVTLAKEARYGIIDVGKCLTWETKGVQVCLDDISTQVEAANQHPAIVSFTDLQGKPITDYNGTPVKDQVFPRNTKKIYVPGYGDIKVHVYQTAPGYGLLAKWAEMAIYADEIILEDGKKFKGSDGKESDYWKVAIGFTVKDGGRKDEANHLKEIMLYDDNGLDNDLTEGEAYQIIDLPGYNVYQLLYRELEKTGVNFDTITFKTTGSTEKQLNHVKPADIPLSFNGTEVKTGIDKGFKYSPYKGDRFYVIMDSNETGYDTGDIIFQDDDGNWYYVDNPGVLAVEYAQAGNNGYVLAYTSGDIMLVEDVGKYKNEDIVDGMDVYMAYNGANLYLYDPIDNKDDEVAFYTGEESEAKDLLSNPNIAFSQLGYVNGTGYEVGKFISLRGTTVTKDKSERQFKVPNKVREVLLRFQPTATAGTNPDTFTCTKPEGEKCNFGNVSILVKSIDEVVSPCSVSGAGACAVGSVNAQIVDENNQAMGAEVTASVPYTLTSNLVYLDSEATGLDTGVVITVGGQAVNKVTASALEEAGITIDPTNNVVVKEVGNKIIVAGYTAEDTLRAVDQFLSGVKRQ
jgi:hypothetical protein